MLRCDAVGEHELDGEAFAQLVAVVGGHACKEGDDAYHDEHHGDADAGGECAEPACVTARTFMGFVHVVCGLLWGCAAVVGALCG